MDMERNRKSETVAVIGDVSLGSLLRPCGSQVLQTFQHVNRFDSDFGILGCDNVWSCRWIPTFLRHVPPLSSLRKIKKVSLKR